MRTWTITLERLSTGSMVDITMELPFRRNPVEAEMCLDFCEEWAAVEMPGWRVYACWSEDCLIAR